MERPQSKLHLTTVQHDLNIKYQCHMVEDSVLYYSIITKMFMERPQSKLKLATVKYDFNIKYQYHMVEEIVL